MPARKELLERCLGGYTQNANESFNATIWQLAPKHFHCGRKIIEIAAYIAAGIFNEGYLSVLRIMSCMEIIIGPVCRDVADRINENRTISQNRRSRSVAQETRTYDKQWLLEKNELYEDTEDIYMEQG